MDVIIVKFKKHSFVVSTALLFLCVQMTRDA